MLARETLQATSLRQQVCELFQDLTRYFFLFYFSLESQVVTGALERQELCFGGDHFHGALQLFDRAERIAGTVHEERGRAQVRKVLRALLLGTARRMERVGQQQQARNQLWFFGAEHAGLTATVGVAAQDDLSWSLT